MLSAELGDGDFQVSLWGIRLLLTIVQRGGSMRLDWEKCPPLFRDQIGDLHNRGLLRAVETLQSEIQVSGTCYLLRTDKTDRVLSLHENAVRQGKATPLRCWRRIWSGPPRGCSACSSRCARPWRTPTARASSTSI